MNSALTYDTLIYDADSFYFLNSSDNNNILHLSDGDAATWFLE